MASFPGQMGRATGPPLPNTVQGLIATVVGGGGSGSFVPQSGFTVTPATSFGDTLPFTVARSSGSFGTHANFNKTGSLQWNGLTYLCFIAKNFEGQSVGTNIIGAALTNGIERSQANGGNAAQWQIASVAPANRTRSAARTRIDATTDPIEVTQPSGETQQYISLKIQPTSGTPAGKFLRSFGVDTRDWWLASGCSDTDVRGAADLMNLGDNTQFSSPNAMTYGAFNQVEFSWNKSDGNGHTWLNGASQWSVNWTDTDWRLCSESVVLHRLLRGLHTCALCDRRQLDVHQLHPA